MSSATPYRNSSSDLTATRLRLLNHQIDVLQRELNLSRSAEAEAESAFEYYTQLLLAASEELDVLSKQNPNDRQWYSRFYERSKLPGKIVSLERYIQWIIRQMNHHENVRVEAAEEAKATQVSLDRLLKRRHVIERIRDRLAAQEAAGVAEDIELQDVGGDMN